MRGTTICRSRLAVLLALVAAPLTVTALAAQDTVRVAPPDTMEAAPPPEVAAEAPSQELTGQLPATHTVVLGETLWSIAQMYFADPLLWPEIYRHNTTVIEDPHWIYPGEVFNLSELAPLAQAPMADTTLGQPQAADTVRADTMIAAADTIPADTAQAVFVEPPPPGDQYRTIFDRPPRQIEEVQNVLAGYANQPYRPLRRGEFYAAGFLTEGERLPYADVLGNTSSPAIYRLSDRTSAHQFEEIAVEPPGDASYHVGDSLLLVRLDRPVDGWGDIVYPVGVARVTEVQERQVLAEVIMQFARIRDGHLALPLEPFRDPGEVRPTPVQQGLQGTIIDQRTVRNLVAPQQYLFIDRGRADGVVPGDIFEVYRPATGEVRSPSEEVRVILMVAHTREHSSTVMAIGVSNPQVTSGMPVRLIKKMPS
ncbi:MAG: LysM peptidoglycan-binding domain-containing protein [Acidimicrobiales bacterium]